MKKQLQKILLLLMLTALASCGGGNSEIKNFSYSVVTTDHGMGVLQDIRLATLNNQIYALVSKASDNRYALSLYRSGDEGKTWQKLNDGPTTLSSLTGYNLTTMESFLVLSGGETTGVPVSANTPRTFNNALYTFTPNTEATGGTWAAVQNGANMYTAVDSTQGGHAFGAAAYNPTKKTLYLQGGMGQDGNGIYVDACTFTSSSTFGASLTQSHYCPAADLPSTNATEGPPFARQHHCMAAMNDTVYVFGGRTTSSTNGSTDLPQASMAYHLDGASYVRVNGAAPYLASPIDLGCVAVSSSQKIALFGGTNSQTLAGTADTISRQLVVIDTTGGTFSIVRNTPLPTEYARYGHGITSLNGHVIVVGGMGTGGKKQTDVLVFSNL